MRIFFRNFELPHVCTVFFTICGTVVKKKMSQGARFHSFWDLLAHFEDQRLEIFGTGMCDRNSSVLPRVVCGPNFETSSQIGIISGF